MDMKCLIKTIKKETGKKYKAVFTIEAAFIIPIVMVIVAVMLFFAFYIHDKIILTSVSTYYVLEHINEYEGNPETIENETKEMLEKRLLILKDAEVSTESSENEWTIKSSGTFNLPFRFLSLFLSGEENTEKSEINISNMKGRSALIKYKVLVDGLDKLTGTNEEASNSE